MFIFFSVNLPFEISRGVKCDKPENHKRRNTNENIRIGADAISESALKSPKLF
jgi:hypothetical protein